MNDRIVEARAGMEHLHQGRQKVIVCYDLPDNRRRARLSAFLEAFGARVQRSVFEAVLTDALAKRLEKGLVLRQR